ncbi:MAG: molybdopterin-binding protein [Myxococcales bacterium]|nr:molybdopterin-binding protein [Myxococcota bacterium]MDW8283043.1 molybdopterin-binding protein [Myxococcales bacterium]
MTTAGLVVIGDEILSGKVADANSPFLIAELRSLGVSLREIAVIPDALDEIADVVRRQADRYDHVFTSGGIGPTHDDVTMEGVARAFGTRVERHPELTAMVRAHYERRGLPVPERSLRLADIPVGATLLYSEQIVWPVVAMRNVYILPGIPEIFQRKFLAIRERFRSVPFHLRQVLVRDEESIIAPHLDAVAGGFPDVALGSYPRWTPAEDGHRVKLTLEGKEPARVEQAFQELVRLLGSDCIVRQE